MTTTEPKKPVRRVKRIPVDRTTEAMPPPLTVLGKRWSVLDTPIGYVVAQQMLAEQVLAVSQPTAEDVAAQG